MRLIVGLGNPGPRYVGTRHNAGFLAVDAYAQHHAATFRSGRHGEEARVGAARLLKPDTFMNLSGIAVQALATKHGIAPDAILVVHDDVDLPLGRLRIREGGGAGGQRGVRDIIERIGPNFVRLKLGIGRPPARWTTENWVTSRFTPDEADLLADVIRAAADAINRIARDGPAPAANVVNAIDLRPAPAQAPAAAGDTREEEGESDV